MSRSGQTVMLALSALPFVFGCGDDESAPPAPLGPPALEVVEFKTTADSWKPGDEPAELTLGCDPKRVVGVNVGPTTKNPGRLDNFALKPPGACGSEPQCGPLVFSLEAGSDSVRVRAFSIFAEAELGDLGLDRSYALRVELRDQQDRPVVVNGVSVSAEVPHLLLRSPEGCNLDGGSEAPEDGGLPDAAADSSEADAGSDGSIGEAASDTGAAESGADASSDDAAGG